MNTDGLDLSILSPAFIAGLLVLATHIPLGREVLRRGIIFIDLAVAQVAGLGVIAAHFFGDELGSVAVQVAAVSAALLAAVLLNFTQKRWPDVQEALIGALFVLAASGGLLLLAGNPHGGEHLKDLLAGQILWVSPTALAAAAALYAIVLGLWFGARERLGGAGFYLLFAITVTASVQLVGIYLVFASLILPALGTRHIRGPRVLAWGYGVGIVGYAAGIVLSSLADLPTGAVVVFTLALVAGITAAAFSSKREKKRSGK